MTKVVELIRCKCPCRCAECKTSGFNARISASVIRATHARSSSTRWSINVLTYTKHACTKCNASTESF